jgi:hypothetical protein
MKILRKKLSKFGKLLTPQEIDEFRRRPTIFDAEKNNEKTDYDYINSALLNNNKNNNDISYLEIRREQLLLGNSLLNK